MPVDFRTRRESLRRLLSERELDAILVTDLLNIRYLTGFTGSNAALVVSASASASDERETVICTDGRYVPQVSEPVPYLRAEIARSSYAPLHETSKAPVLPFEYPVDTSAENRAL